MPETKSKTPVSPEVKALRQAGKALAFNLWRDDWRAANPKATPDERKAAWGEVRKAETRKAIKALKALQKRGAISVNATAVETADAA